MSIIAGTGHRPAKLFARHPYSQANHKRLVSYLTEDMIALDAAHPPIIISGMALGFDQAFAQAALDLGWTLHAYIPFIGQEKRWPSSSQQYYHRLLEQADRIVECSSPGYAAWKMQHRNQMMVDAADMLMALWNGSPGGTANAVKYAESIGRRIHYIRIPKSWRDQ